MVDRLVVTEAGLVGEVRGMVTGMLVIWKSIEKLLNFAADASGLVLE